MKTNTKNTTGPRFDPSFHVYGCHPMREADRDDQKLPGWVVCFDRGFEQMQVAVYGDSLYAGDAEEAAIEYLTKYFPDSLKDAEKNGDEGASHVFKLDPFRDMTADDERELCAAIVREKGVEWLLSVGDVYSIVREELNNEILDRWINR